MGYQLEHKLTCTPFLFRMQGLPPPLRTAINPRVGDIPSKWEPNGPYKQVIKRRDHRASDFCSMFSAGTRLCGVLWR
jgi:hypothetical protein